VKLSKNHWFVGLLIVHLICLFATTGCSKPPAANDGSPNDGSSSEPSSSSGDAESEVAAESANSVPSPSPEPDPTDTPPTATAVPLTHTPTPEPTTEPTAVPTIAATETPVPTESPAPEPTAVVPTVPQPAWLSYLNRFRRMANLPPISEGTAYTLGSQLHSRYMVVNDEPIAHSENVNNPLYDEAGHLAGKNGNIFATSQLEADYVWGINFWISAPFHLVPMISPGLETVGYGNYNEEIGSFHMAAVMDVRSAPRSESGQAEYPIFFPADGSETWIVRHSLFEWPDSTESCPGYSRPTGAPIVLQIGSGDQVPNVTSHILAKGDQALESCIFDETNYRNSDEYEQDVGRTILDIQDAIVIMPRQPLPVNETYTVQVVVNGETYTWSFNTIKGPEG
jgi:uncharacterized protein YkwD